MNNKVVVRLQDFVHPEHYTISIEPSIDMNSYSGSVQIKAKIAKPTKNIILHSKNSKIKTTTICVGTQCLLPKVVEDKDSETIELVVQKEISGEIEIHIEFDGKITENLTGIYRSTYEQNGKKEHLITTQFEAPYAREAFPCFDEPDKKATFDLELVIEKDLKAISNTLIKSEKIEGKKKRVIFKTTPKMSTYLLYIGIGDFEFKESNYNKVKLRVVTTPGKSKNTSFAIEHAKRYLKYFEEYSEIPYPLEKLDLIAVPDFTSAAMENWGAITFREIFLLVEENKTSVAVKKRVAEVIAHELWHQWSGNLVTMKWWNDLWLNESFANYMAYKAVADYKPEWNIWQDYVSGDLVLGLSKDILKTTHPIEVEVKSAQETTEIFDEISYQKGGGVLRMLENYIGEESFRKGVSNYLKENAYSNAKAEDLWNSIDKIAKSKKAKEVMKYWISQPGYPLVSVEKTNGGIKLKQERYNKDTNQVWPIPVSFYVNGKNKYELFEKKEDVYPIKEKPKLNHHYYGFYRTKYSQELLKHLGELIKRNKLDEIDRWGVINDLWSLCFTGKEKLEEYMLFLDNYTDESTYSILADIYASIRKLDRCYYHESWWHTVKEKIVKKLIKSYNNQLNKVGWNKIAGEPTDNSLMRNLCISFCGFAGDKSVIENAHKLYKENKIELDIASSIFYIIAQNGNENTFKDMLARYERSDNVEFKMRFLGGLCQFKEGKIIEKTMDLMKTDKIRTHDLRNVFGNLAANPLTQNKIIKWFDNNWDEMHERLDADRIIIEFIQLIIQCQTTKEGGEEAKKLLDKYKIEYERTKENAFEILDLNLEFIEKNKEFLKNY